MTERQQSEDARHFGEQILTVLDTLAGARDAERRSLVDARGFDEDQLAIETDFRALLAGLGRPGPNRLVLMQKPVLSTGKLQLAEPLPAKTHRVYTDLDWWFSLADAKPYDDGRVLEHWAIEIDPPPRQLVAVDGRGRPIAIGYPRINAGVR
jgi:hypothetical protein